LDLYTGAVTITRTLARVSGGAGVYGAPKTASARRTLTIDETTVAFLHEHRAHLEAEGRARASAGPDQGLVFCTRLGGPLESAAVCAAFRRTLRRADLPAIRFHDLRRMRWSG
jgi:hypothetical protein